MLLTRRFDTPAAGANDSQAQRIFRSFLPFFGCFHRSEPLQVPPLKGEPE
jgi:hypothetical protein